MTDPRYFSKMGEWGLVDWVSGLAGAAVPADMVGPGDDAAVLPFGDGDLVVTTDLVAEGTHFFSDADPVDVGRFAVAVNLSDLAAMGANPVGFVAATGAPGTVPDEWFQGVAKGLIEGLEGHCPLVGGDMKTAPARVVAGTAFGSVPHDGALLRSGAKVGDVLVATGAFGAPGAALHALEEGKIGREEAMRVVHDVTPRVAFGALLREAGAHAAVDTSDSLARALTLIAQRSKVHTVVDLGAIPVSPVVDRYVEAEPGEESWVQAVLGQGGEYELVAAVPPERLERVVQGSERLGLPVQQIGVVREGEGAVGTLAGRSLDLDGLGWRQR